LLGVSGSLGSGVLDGKDMYAGKLSRHEGRRMMTRPHKSGKTPDVYFDGKVCSLADGDQYLDPIYREKEINAATIGKPVSEKPFVPPQNTRKRYVCEKRLHHVCLDVCFSSLVFNGST
jgi:hypothetical protein